MKVKLSESRTLAVVVVVALVAGTALVAGYANRPNDGTQVTADDKCAGCPAKGTDACPKVRAGGCCGTDACPGACEKPTCDAEQAQPACQNSAGACCGQTTEPAACPFQASQPACASGQCPMSN